MANASNLTPETLLNTARTTTAAVAAMLLARVLKLPEFYWAPISAVVIIESTVDPRTVAWQRLVGTALGAVVGGLAAMFFTANAWVYGAGVFLCGAFCTMLRLRGAFRFAVITFSIVLLISRVGPRWIVAGHRFVEVSLGIAVGLAVAEVWPAKAVRQG